MNVSSVTRRRFVQGAAGAAAITACAGCSPNSWRCGRALGASVIVAPTALRMHALASAGRSPPAATAIAVRTSPSATASHKSAARRFSASRSVLGTPTGAPQRLCI